MATSSTLVESHCGACDHPDTNTMVQCDRCDSWWHFSCVGVGDSINAKDFLCPRCMASDAAERRSERARGRTAASSSSSPSGRTSLRLQKLEAEKMLAEKEMELRRKDQERRHEVENHLIEAEKEHKCLMLEKQIVAEKFRMFEDELDDEDDGRSNRSQQSSLSKVRQWRDQLQFGGASSTMLPATTVTTTVHGTTITTMATTIANTLPTTVSQAGIPRLTNLPSILLPEFTLGGLMNRTSDVLFRELVQSNASGSGLPFNALNQNPLVSKPSKTVSYNLIQQTQGTGSNNQPLPNLNHPGSLQCLTNLYPGVVNQNTTGQTPTVILSSGSSHVPVSTNHMIFSNSNIRPLPVVSSTVSSQVLVDSHGQVVAGQSVPIPSTSVSSQVPAGSYFYAPPGLVEQGITVLPQQDPLNFPPFSHVQPMFSGPFGSYQAQSVPSANLLQAGNGSVPSAQPTVMQTSSGGEIPSVPLLGDGPTPRQLAARQAMSKELPIFSGNPEEWPLFISSYHNSTQACGYTDAENLMRLQRCLKGHALDAVRSRLLLPAAVPHVIANLKTLYGRPELLIHTLLQKIRDVPAPKQDKLETLIGFGMAVQSLSDHLEYGAQEAHLNNPTLLYELIEKLPAHLKLDWALYKQRFAFVNLRTFSQYMSTLVSAASEVTLHIEPKSHQRQGKADKPKERNFFGTYSVDELGSSEVQRETFQEQKNSALLVGQAPAIREPSRERVERPPNTPACLVCKCTSHRVKDCEVFSKMSLDERWKTIQKHILCRICLGAHGRRPCKSKRKCEVDGCQARHHSLLHSTQSKAAQDNKSSKHVGVANHHHSERSTLFRIIPVTLHGNNRSITVYAFLDDGSSLTLVDKGVVEELGVDGESIPLCLQWTAKVTRSEPDSKRVSLEISELDSDKRFKISDARTVSRLELPRQSLCYDELISKYPHLKGLPVKDYHRVIPRILIGNDNSHLGVPHKVREGKPQQPIAVKCRLGWSIYGATNAGNTTQAHSLHICECSEDKALHDLVKQNFSIENVGISLGERSDSKEDERAKTILRETTRRVGQRYETGLLWRYDTFEFPDNFAMAERRLQCLERRMKSNPVIGASVTKQIQEYQEKGYIRQLSEQELSEADPRRTWYLPLGVALNPKKPSKIRIFCDAAAKVNGISLNSMLLPGPDLLSSLPAVLFGFREKKIAFCADIQEMFHQIMIRKEDQHAQRLLWRDDPLQPPKIFAMNVATFGATCSPSSAQFTKNLNAKEHAKDYPAAADAIVRRHYVDDYLDSADSVQEAVRRALDVKHIHSQGGFHIRNWLSNSREFLTQVGERQPAMEKSLNLQQESSTERVLGMQWRPAHDDFNYSSTMVSALTHPTKRQVLRSVMSLFDPLGLLSFFLIHGRILIQDIWRAKTDWDEIIPEELAIRWQQWTELFCRVNQISIPRCYFPGRSSRDIKSLQLHVFVDASDSAYACVAYLRAEFDDEIVCALVASKAKVAPLKSLSIPRLELQAALIGVRLAETITGAHELPITKRVFWSDSKVTLAWLCADHLRYREFVEVRRGEILTKTDPEEWRWIPSKENVADDATKWGRGPCFLPGSRWFQGPDFLYQPEGLWPDHNEEKRETTEEIRKCMVHHQPSIQPIVDWSRFSQWNRLWRAVAYVHRFIQNLRRKVAKDAIDDGPLTKEELAEAEASIWKMVQRETYPVEIEVLSESRTVESIKRRAIKLKRNSKIRNLSPFLDAFGVLRSESRIIVASYIGYDMKFPIILPREHHVVRILIGWYHRKYLHANGELVVNEVRQRWHISNLRTVVRKVMRDCFYCKVKKAVPSVPRMAPLPAARLQAFVRPFSFVGVDYFGPLSVSVGRSCVKRWVALFTCLTVRAIHLEVVHSISTESCKMAIRRFIARRGSPLEIHSDNGTNFSGANNELQRELSVDNRQLAETFTNAHTKWVFNPPAAPHMGGAWERLVRSAKAALASLSTSRNPNEETFGTLIVEVEGVINSRPLTFIPLQTSDQEALTPNHFLLLSSSGVTQTPKTLAESTLNLRVDWNLLRIMVDQFWRRWIREYLPTIARRTKWFEDVKPIEPNDLVIVVDESTRNGWIRGRVLSVEPGKDGRVRQAVVQTSATSPLRRPVAKLARLDVGESKTALLSSEQCYGRGNVTECRTNPVTIPRFNGEPTQQA